MKTIFKQIGPKFGALTMSLSKEQATKIYLDNCFSESVFDPSSLPDAWPMQTMMIRSAGAPGAVGPDSLSLDIPKTEIFSLLPPDILTKMVSAQSSMHFLPDGSVTKCDLIHRAPRRARPRGSNEKKRWMKSTRPCRVAMVLSREGCS
jgi:hypothetical protein